MVSKSDKFIKELQTEVGARILELTETTLGDILASDAFVEAVEGLIKEGEFDDAVADRFASSDGLIEGFCEECDHRCSMDNCPRRE